MAISKSQFRGIVLLLCFSSFVNAQVLFDVTKFGAASDGKSDIKEAVLKAWTEACASANPATVLVPKGTYTLGEVLLKGPCKSSMEFQVQGTLLAPPDPSQFQNMWVTINYLNNFMLSGGGIFDGQGGSHAWGKNDCHKNKKCAKLPYNLSFNFLNNSIIKDVTTKDSKNFHVNVIGCHNVTFHNFTISAPAESPNTDGIHIGRSTNINITASNIQTGDDCISLGDGSKQVYVERVNCGPGHGISVGSLGRNEKEEPVVGFYVRNCTLKGTDNGIRIKTWPASFEGTVSDIHFEDVIMENVSNPIIIDQVYCPWNQCNAKLPSLVKISNVSIKGIRGTSATPVATKIACSPKIPCENVEVGDVDLKYHGAHGPAVSACSNVNPKIFGVQFPPACSVSTDKIAETAGQLVSSPRNPTVEGTSS